MKTPSLSSSLAALGAAAALASSSASAQMVLEGDIVTPGGLDAPNLEQDPLPGTNSTVTYKAEGQFATAAGVSTCTFSSGDWTDSDAADDIPGNTWFIRTQATTGGYAVEGCQPLVQTANQASRRLPRNSKKIPSGGLSGDGDVANKDGWCFIGAVNSGGNAGDGKANYNALNSATNTQYNEWAYCTEEHSKEVRYTVSASFSETEGYTTAGAPCANEWNYNNNTNGAGGVKVGVLQSCLPFADYKPRTEGLDLSAVPEADQKYWCFINTGDGSAGYNPLKVTNGDLDPKTLDWGFCQDALATTSGTDVPTASPTASPEAGPAPATSAPSVSPIVGVSVAPTGSAEETSAPTASETTTAAPTTTGEQTDSNRPSAAHALGAPLVAALLLTAAQVVAN